jgi:hypothetical protein
MTVKLVNHCYYDMRISFCDPNCCAIMFSRSRLRSGPGTGGTAGSPCSTSQLQPAPRRKTDTHTGLASATPIMATMAMTVAAKRMSGEVVSLNTKWWMSKRRTEFWLG